MAVTLILACEGGSIGPSEGEPAAEGACVQTQGPSRDPVERPLAALDEDGCSVLPAEAPREDTGDMVSILLGAGF